MLYRLTLKTWQWGCDYPPLTYTYCGETQEEICARVEDHAATDPLLSHLLNCGELSWCWDCCETCEVADAEQPMPPPVPPSENGGRRPEAAPHPGPMRPVSPWRRVEAAPAPRGPRPLAEPYRRSFRPIVPTIY